MLAEPWLHVSRTIKAPLGSREPRPIIGAADWGLKSGRGSEKKEFTLVGVAWKQNHTLIRVTS